MRPRQRSCVVSRPRRYAYEWYEGPLPRYVEDELRGYAHCGDFSRGFVRLRCPRCELDLLVPFSCKNCALCPSCAGRRMAAQAAHLVDGILPSVPIRQFVLSFPFELSLLAATKPEVLRALARIHAEELARHFKSAAKKSGATGMLHAGSVTFVQRFGSSLNVHVHLHTCALDGVYVEDADSAAPRFVPAAAPSRAELFVLAERVALRVMTWLRKRGYAKEDEYASNDVPQRSFAEVLAQVKACDRCSGRLEVRAVMTAPVVARTVLDALAATARAPPSTDATLVVEPAFA